MVKKAGEMTVADVAPPPRKGPPKKVDWPKVAEFIRANPGKWCEVPVDLDPSMMTRLKAGDIGGIEAGEFDWTARRVEHGGRAVRIWGSCAGTT